MASNLSTGVPDDGLILEDDESTPETAPVNIPGYMFNDEPDPASAPDDVLEDTPAPVNIPGYMFNDEEQPLDIDATETPFIVPPLGTDTGLLQDIEIQESLPSGDYSVTESGSLEPVLQTPASARDYADSSIMYPPDSDEIDRQEELRKQQTVVYDPPVSPSAAAAPTPAPSPTPPSTFGSIVPGEPGVNQTPEVIPYESANLAYSAYMNKLNSEEEPAGEGDLKDAEVTLAQLIVANVFIDATSAMAGERTFDDIAKKIGAPAGDRDYRQSVDMSDFNEMLPIVPLVDREDYADFALNRVVRMLHENKAPTSLMREVMGVYDGLKDEFDSMTDVDVFYTGEALRYRSAKTYAQLLSIPLNMILTPAALVVAKAAGKTRNPGEPHDNLGFLKEATARDMRLLNGELDGIGMAEAANRIANRSYYPIVEEDGEQGDWFKLQTSDVMYINQPKIKGPWLKGLKKHIKKVVSELPPIPTYPSEKIRDEMLWRSKLRGFNSRDPEVIYNSLKDIALMSYSDVDQSEISSGYGRYMRGYPPIRPPKGGWAFEAGSRNASRRVAKRIKAMGFISDFEPGEEGEGPPGLWEILGSIGPKDYARASSQKMMGGSLVISAMFDRGDYLPEEASAENRLRLIEQIKAGAFGKTDNAEASLAILEKGSINHARYGSMLKEFTRNMLTMMGPKETARMLVMALAGFKKYGLPSLLPGAEVGGMFSGEDLSLFGKEDVWLTPSWHPMLEALDITREDIDVFWRDSPGIAAIMIPGMTKPLGVVLGGVVKMSGATARAISKAKAGAGPKNSGSWKARKKSVVELIVDGIKMEYGFLTEELAYAEKNRTAGKPKTEKVVSASTDYVVPPEQTATALRTEAAAAEATAAKMDPADTGAKTHKEVANSYNAAADALDSMNRAEELANMASKEKQTIVDSLLSTEDRARMYGPEPKTPKPPVENPIIRARIEEMIKVDEFDTGLINQNSTNKGYRSPGRRAFTKAMRRVALEMGYTKVSQKFKDEVVFGKERAFANRLAKDGITDPRVYRHLLPEASMDGPNGIASLVFKAERSVTANAKAAFHSAMEDVARLRNVAVEEVYSATAALSVADDFIANGVTSLATYALLGLKDLAARKAVRDAKARPERPVVKPKSFADKVISVVEEVAVTPPLTTKRVLSDSMYGAGRAVLGRKPANILSNRLNSVRGKGNTILPMSEASLLSVAEFMKSPFAFINFPSWFGEFTNYMYSNSTGKSGSQRAIRHLFNMAISPSGKLGSEIYNWVVHSEGKKKIAGYEIDQLAKRFDDESAQSARNFISDALDEVGLDQHKPGELNIRLAPNNTLSNAQKNNIAIGFMNMSDDGYINIPESSPGGGSQRLYIKDVFTLEYKVDGKWINAWEAGDQMAVLKQQGKDLRVELGDLSKRTKEIQSLKVKESNSKTTPDANLTNEAAQLDTRRKEIAVKLDEIRAESEAIDKKFGTAESVFKVSNGRITGVQDIRFNIKEAFDGPIGDVEQTVLGIANAYVRPMQFRIMEMGANLAVGEGAIRMKLNANMPKNAVTILNTETGERKHVRTFKATKGGVEKARAFTKDINERNAKSGNKFELAEAVTEGISTGEVSITGKRDLNLKGYDAVATTAGFMSSYFTETAFLDFIHDHVQKFKKGEITGGELAKENQFSAKLLVKMYPDNVIKKLRKDFGKKGANLSDTQVAALIVRGLEDGSVAKLTAKGSGRFFKERLWVKAMTFDERKDFYALYTSATEKAHNQLIKRTEHYRMLHMLREKGLILTLNEIENTPGLSTETSQFIPLSSVAKKYPGLVDDLPGGYIHKDMVDGLVAQQNLIAGVTKFGQKHGGLGKEGFFSSINRTLKRGAVVSFVNGTMVRNAAGGIAVQAQMADIPATMRYTLKAAKANKAIKNGLPPEDLLMRELSELLGGPGRSTIELGAATKKVQVVEQNTHQAEYLFKVLSGDNDTPPLGVAVSSEINSAQKTVIGGVARALDPKNKASLEYNQKLALDPSAKAVAKPPRPRDVGAVESVVGAAKGLGRTVEGLGDAMTGVYSSIDDVLRLAYAYELVRKHGKSPAEAAAAARKVFYDYPDIGPVMQLLRDAPLIGLPFIGYQLWSTKAFGRYFEKNPLKASIVGGLVNALTESTNRALNIASTYDTDVFDGPETANEFGMPMIESHPSTAQERHALVSRGVPPEEALMSIGQVKVKQSSLGVGAYADTWLFGPGMKAAETKEMSVTENLLVSGGAMRSMLASGAGKFIEDVARGESQQAKIDKEMQLNIAPADGGGFLRDAASGVGDFVEFSLEALGYVYSDARGLAKIVSNATGKPYAGQERPALDTWTNVLGVAMKVTDPRLANRNFNNNGQRKIRDIGAALMALRRGEKDVISAKGQAYYDIKRTILLEALHRFEVADDIFKENKRKDGVMIQENVVLLMRAMLKYDLNNPKIETSYRELLDYYMLNQ